MISDSELTVPMERRLSGGTLRHNLELRLDLAAEGDPERAAAQVNSIFDPLRQ